MPRNTKLRNLQPEMYDFIYEIVVNIVEENEFEDTEEFICQTFRKEFTYMFDEDETKFPLINIKGIKKYVKSSSYNTKNLDNWEIWEIRDLFALCLSLDIFCLL